MDLNPIGIVHTVASDDQIRTDYKNLEATVEILPEYSEGLDGLEGYSHVFVIGYFNRLRTEQVGVLKVRPRRHLKEGMKIEKLPLVGVFAVGSPSRPNPIGLSLVELLKVDGRFLTVKGLDYFDGTPVLDLKPYTDNYRVNNFRAPDFNIT
ncbi:MAG TPA: tRNA (N6-threonylcarbamoyladenosine(37)-N6)-methyltransferase TrmO [Methylomirabilota bacterium]|nr:tRNA (N6-threonylcarbamoyladenosine(37)-N6)-methyltransferase TrmO [Methylomirabilota bacterium]